MKNLFNFTIYILFSLSPLIAFRNTNIDTNNEPNHIYIPKINVSNSIYSFDDVKNNVNENVYLAVKYNFDNLSGSLVLASHSGNSPISYFNDIDRLSFGDEIFIEDKNNIYTYLVDDVFIIDKTGLFKYNVKDKYIYLITCVKGTHKKQLIIGGFLNKITKKSTFS